MIGIINGNSMHLALPAKSVHVCVTSPPYYQQRKYSDDWREVGGEDAFDCGAWLTGEENCLDCYVCALRLVFREVHRVLRDDGLLWLNLGNKRLGSDNLLPAWRVCDALVSDGWILKHDVIWAKGLWEEGQIYTVPMFDMPVHEAAGNRGAVMPESQNGWRYERCKNKTAPAEYTHSGGLRGVNTQAQTSSTHMSTRQEAQWAACTGCDECKRHNGYVLRKGSWRPTTAHEYIFLLAKRPQYFADREAVKVQPAKATISDGRHQHNGQKTPHAEQVSSGAELGNGSRLNKENGANLRGVWKFKPAPFKGDHYAVFPPSLPELCISASTSDGGVCSDCGAPYARVIERSFEGDEYSTGEALRQRKRMAGIISGGTERVTLGKTDQVFVQSKGFLPTCEHEAAPIGALVLDPFLGSGTTVAAAQALGRRGVGFDINFDYLAEHAFARTEAEKLRLWASGLPAPNETRFDDLPLFGGA